MPNKEEINAVPVTPFFYDPVQVEAKTDVKSMPKLDADVKVKEIPKIQTEVETSEDKPINVKGDVTVKTDPTNPPQENVTLNPQSQITDLSRIGQIDSLFNIRAINDITKVTSIEHVHDVQLNGDATKGNAIHFVVDNASEIGTPDIQMSATVDDSTGTPNVAVTKSGDKGNPMFDFEFSGLKGEKGEQGEKGDAGEAGTTPDVSATASVSSNGKFGVNVSNTGTITAPNFRFAFTGLSEKYKTLVPQDGISFETTLTTYLKDNYDDYGYYDLSVTGILFTQQPSMDEDYKHYYETFFNIEVGGMGVDPFNINYISPTNVITNAVTDSGMVQTISYVDVYHENNEHIKTRGVISTVNLSDLTSGPKQTIVPIDTFSAYSTHILILDISRDTHTL